MSTSAPRWIIVDDTATDVIHYTGLWFEDSSGSQDSAGNFGPVFQETLHGTKNDASLSFAFNGSQVRLFGSNNLRNDSGVLDPVWECFIDGVSIGATTPFQFAENNWVFCDSQSKISDGSHVFTVNATVAKSQTFWIDQIQYLPSASVAVDNLTILVDSLDPQLAGAYGAGWGALGGSANVTGQTGSLFTFNFTGVSLSWYGFIPVEFAIAATTSTYAIDGQTPNSFLLKGLSSKNSNTIYNQKFFQTPTLSPGKHQIVVTFQGSGTTTPLTLDYLVIQNASIPSTTTSGSTTTTSSTSSGSSNGGTSASKSNIGAIAGGIVGGVVIILLAILAYLFLRRRNRALRSSVTEKDIDGSAIPRPFVYTPVSPTEDTSDTRRQCAQWDGDGGTSATRGTHNPSQPSFSLTEFSLTQSGATPTASTFSGPSSNANTTGHVAHSASGSAVGAPTSVASQPWQPSSRSEKFEREAAAAATVLRPQARGAAPQTPSLASPSLDDSVTSRYVHHADSGIRLPSTAETERVVEVPPEYTLS